MQPRAPSTAFFYGTQIPVPALTRFQQLVVEADSVSDLELLKEKGTEVFAYVSVGEAEGWRNSAATLPQELFLDENVAWQSRIADLTRKEWRDYLLNQRIEALWAAGYRGFFLDTLDSYVQAAKSEEERNTQLQALADIILLIHKRYPEAKLLLNRGFDVLPLIASAASGIVAESLFQKWDAVSGQYVDAKKDDTEWLLWRLNQVQERYFLPVVVIDYVHPSKPELAKATADRITKLGFSAWVANHTLDVIGYVGTK